MIKNTQAISTLKTSRERPWKIGQLLLILSLAQYAIFGMGSLFEYAYSFIVCFHYIIGYLNALVIMLAILRVHRFGAGTAVYLFYAGTGVFIEYYMEWVLKPTLIAPWAAILWALGGLVTGFAADLAFKFLPASLDLRRRSIITGVVIGCVDFLSVLAILAFLYVNPVPAVAHILRGVEIMLPLNLIMCGFGGYTAYAIITEKN